MAERIRKFYEAINEGLSQAMEKDSSIFVMGLGVPDPKGVFGTTLGLKEKFGAARVFDMPTSENAMTGVTIGAALTGMRPVLTHQRVDFALLSMDQIVSQAAKWHYMFGGKKSVPIVIRMIIGRGWGQGAQHSQSLQAWFSHVPGLKVIMPTTPFDAKGLLVAGIRDANPVVILEHRWLYNTFGHVPEKIYDVPIGKARVMVAGSDVTVVSLSQMTLECVKAAGWLEKVGVKAEVIDLRSVSPLDYETIFQSVRKTGRLIVADPDWRTTGVSSEIISSVCEKVFKDLKQPPRRITWPDCPSPTSPALSAHYYPGPMDIFHAAADLLKVNVDTKEAPYENSHVPLDVPDKEFSGPF